MRSDGDDLSPDHPGGFYTMTNKGRTIHIAGDENMAEEIAEALREMADRVFAMMEEREIASMGTNSLPRTNGGGAGEKHDDDPAELAAAWPDMPDLTDGVDRFDHHPIAGEPPPKNHKKSTETPLRSPIGRPRTLAEVDHELARVVARMGSDDKAAHLREVLAELQMMSADGTMPTMVEWDAKKPAGMLSSSGIIKRHELTWNQLAGYARLSANKGGRPTTA